MSVTSPDFIRLVPARVRELPLLVGHKSLWKKFQDWLPADTVSINQALIISYLAYASETLAPRTVLSTDVPKSFVYELVNYC